MLMDLTRIHRGNEYRSNLALLAQRSKPRFHIQVTHDVVLLESGLLQKPHWIDYKSMNARA